MTSHREAPSISKDPVADNTDLYAFVSPDRPDMVTLIANYIPLEEPAGGPNFHLFGDDVLYEIMIDNNGDGLEDITYQFRFKTEILDPNTFLYNTGPVTFNAGSGQYDNLNMRQSYSVTRVVGRRRTGTATQLASGLTTPPVNIGPKSTPNYETTLVSPAIHSLPTGEVVFAGQRDEGFYVDLGSIFDLLVLRPFAPAQLVPPSLQASSGVDDTSGFNVHSIAIQIPITQVTRNGSKPTDVSDPAAVIGIWASASRQKALILDVPSTTAGPFTQVSRLGNPLVNEVLIPLGKKDLWNATEPKDEQQFLQYYLNPEPATRINQLYGIAVPSPPRNDIAAIFLTGFSLQPGLPFTNSTGSTQAEYLRLNVAVPPSTSPSSLGILGGDLAGFPNGRRVFDDVIDIELRALAGATPFTPNFNVSPNNQLSDGVDMNDRPYLSSFPYLGTPHQGFSHTHKHE